MASRKDNDEPLKAVVLADHCGATEKLNLAAGKPLLNVPILSWQLATLARYGVKEAVVLSSTPIEDMYADPLGRMKITPLSDDSWNGEGDAIRDLERRDGIRPVDDFILVRCGTVFNVDVSKLVSEHKRRRDIDRNWLITAVFRRGAGSAKTSLVIAVDAKTNTLVKYADSLTEDGISLDIKAENAGLQIGGMADICSDVLDVGLDVCAPDFMVEFRENFYYDNIRAYIKEKLDGGEAEVFGNRMYAHFLKSRDGEFASRITSLVSYAQLTSDALNGWMSPISDDSAMAAGRLDAEHEISTEYMVERSRVGVGVSIAVGSTIVESVIGNNVKIGSDVTIVQSVVMDGAVIADRVDVERSVVNENCTIREDSYIPRNCYIDENVYVGLICPTLSPRSLITLRSRDQFEDRNKDDDEFADADGTAGAKDDEEEANQDVQNGSFERGVSNPFTEADAPQPKNCLGTLGKGRILENAMSSRVDPFFLPKQRQETYFESDEDDALEEDDETDQEDEENKEDEDREVGKLIGQFETANLGDEEVSSEEERTVGFNEEAFETIERALTENVSVDNTSLEINSLKLAYHCTFAETMVGVVGGIALATRKKSAGANLYGALLGAVQKHMVLITKFGKDEEVHHVQVADGLAKVLDQHSEVLKYVYQVMYDKDILDEEGIVAWGTAERQRVEAGRGNKALLDEISPFLYWLENADEEEDE